MLNLKLYVSERYEPYQINFYNKHNGYYPHEYEVVSTVNGKEFSICSGCL